MARSSTFNTVMIQVAVAFGMLLITPMMLYVFTRDFQGAYFSLFAIAPSLIVSFSIFLLNYWWFVPKFYFQNKKLIFFLLNLSLFGILNILSIIVYINSVGDPLQTSFIFSTTLFIYLLFLVGAAALAYSLRNSQRNNLLRKQIEEEKRRHTEAELVWLKNQINPHFLFNTLNNISALVEFDKELAQDSISQLSSLLRYAMYESSKPLVPLEGEVNFMNDYISLMQLRCNSRTKIVTDFRISSKQILIAPLLLISLIENAFKHGVSASKPSFITITLIEENGNVNFICINSNHAKGDLDKSGSGIGLTNMRRRLDILYPGKYEWNQNSNEEEFKIAIKIEL